MYIYGSECTLTLIRDDRATAIPYSLETLREERTDVPLDPLVGYILPLSMIPAGTAGVKVIGCCVTRLCLSSLKPLASLMTDGYTQPFTLLLNRIAERRVYTSLRLTGWELRASRDESAYLRFDVEGREAADPDHTTGDASWVQSQTLTFYDGDISVLGETSCNIYRFSLTRIYGDAISTILQLHYPLKESDALNNAREIGDVAITLGDSFRVRMTNAVLLSFTAKTDNAEEILVVRRYRIDGICLVEVRAEDGVWGAPR